MKLLILGATGATGQLLVKEATAQQHDVTVLVRSPEKLQTAHEKLTIIKGDALNESDVAKAVEGKDAVLSALGVGDSLKSNDFITKAVRILIPAMQQAQVRRLVMLSAFGVGSTFQQASFLQRLAYRLPLKDVFRDKANADSRIQQSNLNYTIVCPVKLTNGAYTGTYKAAAHIPMRGFPSISRADVAHFMVHRLEDAEFFRRMVVLKG